jgi:carboxylesterase
MKALVLHGFTGSLDTVAPLATELEKRGLEVATPVLRGHGTHPEHLFRVHWRDWVADARSALVKLAPDRKEPVVVAGLSMGAMLACVMAAEFSGRVERLALIAPAFRFRSRLIHAIPLLKRVWHSWAGNPEYADPHLISTNTNYPVFPIESFEQTLSLTKVTEDMLGQVHCPVGTFYAKKDPIIPPKVLKIIDKKLGSGPAQRFIYKKSYHEMLCDVEGETVCSDVASFLCGDR